MQRCIRPSFCSNATPTDQNRDKDHKLCTYHGLSPELHPWAILSNIMCVCGDFMSISFFVAVLHLCLQSIYPFSPTYKILGHGVKDVLHHGQDGNLSSISCYFFITLFYSVACVSCSFCFFLWSFCNSFRFRCVSLLSFCCHFSFHFDWFLSPAAL